MYAYLRRLGYVVTRTTRPSDAYPAAAPFSLKQLPPGSSIWQRLWQLITRPTSVLLRLFIGAFSWWQPLRFSHLLHHNLSYRTCRRYVRLPATNHYVTASVFVSLRFLPSGYGVPLYVKKTESSSPYELFYNLYKPSTPFKKTAPPPPDFSVVVIKCVLCSQMRRQANCSWPFIARGRRRYHPSLSCAVSSTCYPSFHRQSHDDEHSYQKSQRHPLYVRHHRRPTRTNRCSIGFSLGCLRQRLNIQRRRHENLIPSPF